MLKTEDLYLKLQSIVCRFWIEITMINHKPVTAEWFISLETWLKSFFFLWDINWTSMQSLYWFCYLFWTWSQIPVSVSINTRVYSIIRLFNLWWKVLARSLDYETCRKHIMDPNFNPEKQITNFRVSPIPKLPLERIYCRE